VLVGHSGRRRGDLRRRDDRWRLTKLGVLLTIWVGRNVTEALKTSPYTPRRRTIGDLPRL